MKTTHSSETGWTHFPLPVDERIQKTGVNTQVGNGSDVLVREVRRVEHQVRHRHRVHLHVGRTQGAHDRGDHVGQARPFRSLVGAVPAS